MSSALDRSPSPPDEELPDEELLAECFDRFVEDILEGRSSDWSAITVERPDLAVRIAESYRLACRLAGRRSQVLPSVPGYEILREIGRGGMGAVYLARHKALGRLVALKVLPASFGPSESSQLRFVTEARALARLNDDRIVRIHNIVDSDDLLAYEMEWIDGPSLRDVIDRLRPFGREATVRDLERALGCEPGRIAARSLVEFFVQVGVVISGALDVVHRAGLVHRDVKPSNILIRKDGTALLADFGLVRDSESSLTRTGAFLGTLLYSAPEQLRGEDDEAVDGRADIYSLGVTLYEAIALRPPFDGRTSADLLRRIETGQAVRLRRAVPHVSRDLQTVLEAAMDPLPGARYASAADFAADLERLLRLQPIRARPAGWLVRSVRFVRRSRRTWLAGAVGAAVVAAVLAPQVAEARARGTRELEARAAVQAARTRLVSPESRYRAWRAIARDDEYRGVQLAYDAERIRDFLREALASYDRAVALVPDDADLRLERDVVHAAAHAGDRDADATARFDALPPIARTAVQRFGRGMPNVLVDRAALRGATPEDRVALGLFAYLIGDFATCELAWQELDPVQTELPVVHAALGILYLADGRPERAYPQLFHAMRALPDASFLAVDLAESALALGDLGLAERWLARGRTVDPTSTHAARVAADLQFARGDFDSARLGYQSLAVKPGADPLPALQLARLEIETGELRAARDRLRELASLWPRLARVRRQLAALSLATGDVPGYLQQVLWVVERGWGVDSTPGSARDMREILRSGGLHGLATRARQACLERADAGTGEASTPCPLVPRPFRSVAEIETLVLRIAALRAGGEGGPARPSRRPDGTATWVLRATAGLPELVATASPLAAAIAAPLAGALLPHRDRIESALRATRRGGGPPHPGVALRSHHLFTARGDAAGDMFASAANAGDVDGDGSADLVVGTLGPGGYVRVYSGRTGRVLIEHVTGRPGHGVGNALAAAGDLDGDGFGDVLLGAPGAESGYALALSGRDGGVLVEVHGDATGDEFGAALAAFGDVDGDGTIDFAVGAPGQTLAPGYVRVHSGRDGRKLYDAPGQRGDRLGTSIAPIGDVDADGIGDFASGAFTAHSLGGTVRAFSGRDGRPLWSAESPDTPTLLGVSLADLGDLDGDGFHEIAAGAPAARGEVRILSARDGSLRARLVGVSPTHGFGFSLAAADIDGDGVRDLAVGGLDRRPLSDVRVYDGSALGRGETPEPMVLLASGEPDDRFGASVACLGDLDGDGRDELAIGAVEGESTGLVRVLSPRRAILAASAQEIVVARGELGLFADGDVALAHGVAVAVGEAGGTTWFTATPQPLDAAGQATLVVSPPPQCDPALEGVAIRCTAVLLGPQGAERRGTVALRLSH